MENLLKRGDYEWNLMEKTCGTARSEWICTWEGWNLRCQPSQVHIHRLCSSVTCSVFCPLTTYETNRWMWLWFESHTIIFIHWNELLQWFTKIDMVVSGSLMVNNPPNKMKRSFNVDYQAGTPENTFEMEFTFFPTTPAQTKLRKRNKGSYWKVRILKYLYRLVFCVSMWRLSKFWTW